MITNNMALACLRILLKYCRQQENCLNCIFADDKHCQIGIGKLHDVFLSHIND